VYFSLLTLALSAMLYAVSFRWTEVTGGENGLGGITPADAVRLQPGILDRLLLVRGGDCVPGADLVVALPQFDHRLRCWWRSARTSRRARFLGYPTNRYKLAAFVLSAGHHRACRHTPALPEPHDLGRSDLRVVSPGDLLAMGRDRRHAQFPRGPALGALFLYSVPRNFSASTPRTGCSGSAWCSSPSIVFSAEPVWSASANG